MKAGVQIILFSWILLIFSSHAYAQSALEVFGKNRIQYKNFEWKYISTINFEVYYYQEGNEMAYFAARHAEADFDRIADLLGYTPYSKTKIFIYNSTTDLQQSNVGLNNDAPLVGGQTNFVKSRIEIAYPGSAVAFRKELSLGIAQMYITEMMFGGSLKDMVQSSYLLSLPEWFVPGAAAYVAEGWGAEMDDYMRDIIVHKRNLRPTVLTGDEARLTGQSIWNYIAERYGKSNISNILNLTRIIRNEESSIVSTLGVYPYSNFLRDWQNFYTSINAPVINNATMPVESVRMRKNATNRFIYNEVKLSPDGKQVAYSETYRGKFRVYIRNTSTGKRKGVMSGGYRVIDQKFDQTIPLLGWRNNTQLVVIHTKEGEYAVSVYDVTKNFLSRMVNRKRLNSVVQVNNFDVSEDGKQLVMSAVKNGRNDIFLYEIGRGAISQITDDVYDDLYPQFMSSPKDIIFSSNRLTDSLKTGKQMEQNLEQTFRLYTYQPGQSTQRVTPLTETPGNSTYPIVDNDKIYFLNDMTGVTQLYRYDATSRQVQQISTFRQNLRAYDLKDNSLAYVILDKRKAFAGYSRNFTFSTPTTFIQTKRSELVLDKINPAKTLGLGTQEAQPAQGQEPAVVQNKKQLVLEPGEVDTDNYEFDNDSKKQSGTENTSTQSIIATVNEGKGKKQNVQIKGPFGYQSLFSIDNAITSLVVDPIRGLGLTFDVTMNEMLEDHVIKGGAVGFFDLASSNFYGEYRYLKKRLDVGVRYDKKTYFCDMPELEFTQRYTSHRIQLPISYPLTVSSRITVAPTLMYTRYVQAQIITGTVPPIAATGYGGFRAEYVFDNTTINGLNMIRGTRIRFRYDVYNGIMDKDSIVNTSAKNFTNLNIDFRHYQKVHRDIILAVRLAYGKFAGRAPKQYMLGGMDNWAFNNRETRTQNDPLEIKSGKDNRDILFNEFVTNMRGFAFNKLSGNSFLLLNTELRLPLIKYFYRGPITSNFFKNLQFVGFTDIGTAWSGASPFSRKNSLNTLVIRNGPFLVSVTNFKNPFLVGYGAGARTLLFGYYLKFDVAWGMEDFVVSEKPQYYFTLGYDF